MARQLNLDRDQLDSCYETSGRIVSHAMKYIDRHSSVAVERATLMCLGFGCDVAGARLAKAVVSRLTKDQLRLGVATWWGRALVGTKEEPISLAEKLGRGKIKWESLPEVPAAAIRKETESRLSIKFQRKGPPLFDGIAKQQLALRLAESKPRKFAGLSEEALKMGANLVVAELVHKKYFQEDFPCDDLGEVFKNLQGMRVVATIKGLSLPEQLLLSFHYGVGALQLDNWSSLLLGDLEPKRALIDHCFALLLAKFSSPFLMNDSTSFKTSSPKKVRPHQWLAILLLYEQLASGQGFPLERLMFASSPIVGEGAKDFRNTLAFAQVLRETFPQSLLWYELPQMDPLQFFVGSFADHDFLIAPSQATLKQGLQMMEQMDGISQEFSLSSYGAIAREANLVVEQTFKLLKKMEHLTLWKSLEQDLLVSKEHPKAVEGEGVFQKSYHYWNPILRASEQA